MLFDRITIPSDLMDLKPSSDLPSVSMSSLARKDIPEHKIRERYGSSMRNLCRLAPGLDKLAVYDNSMPLCNNGLPDIHELVSIENGKMMRLDTNMPNWAKPVAAVCLQHSPNND